MKPVIRMVLFAASVAILAMAANYTAKEQLRSRLREADPDAAFRGFALGTDAVFLCSLSLPGMGIEAESVWVIFEGIPFHIVPSVIVMKGGTVTPRSESDENGFRTAGSGISAVSVMDMTLPDGSALYASRSEGKDLIAMQGLWGEILLQKQGDAFTGVFRDLSGFPFNLYDMPFFLQGHSVSGFCSGRMGDSPGFTGTITGLDGRRASALFEYSFSEDLPRACFTMDFSQVGEPAMAILDSLSRGAVTIAVPSGSLLVTLSGPDSVFFATALNFHSVTVYSESIAPDTFFTSAFLRCSGFALPESSLLFLDSGLVRIGEADVHFDLLLSWGERRRLVLNAWNDSLSGESITNSIPEELMGRLRGLSLAGSLEFLATLVLNWDDPDSCDFQMDLDVSGLYVSWSPVSFSGLSGSAGGAACTMRDSWGNTRVIGLDALHNESFVVFDSMPAFFEPILCCAEDASFRRHHGFSEHHIRNSIRANMQEGRFVRGGSTISMQLAKNLFLGREKTMARKLQEVFLTWRLESLLTKNRILELYANIVELGPGVFGFNSAALYYFNKSFSELSVRETTFLVSILPGPAVYHRFGVRGEVPAYWDSYIDRLITICGDRGWLDRQVVNYALSDTLIFSGPVRGF